MKNRRNLFSLATLICGLQIGAQTVTVEGINYMVDLNTKTASCSGPSSGRPVTDLTIPDFVTYQGYEYPVTIIDDGAFNTTNLTGSLMIGNNVETIGSRAFLNCWSLDGTLTIGNSVQNIGSDAFGSTNFTGELILPATLETIGNGAFNSCMYFTGSLMIPNSVKSIGKEAFSSCTGFDGELILGTSLETIGESAFSGCHFFTGNLSFPESLTSIGNKAFYNCYGFKGSLSIGNKIAELGEWAFYNCYGFNGTLYLGGELRNIPANAFYQCSGFTRLELSQAITEIGDYAFYACRGLQGELTLPDKLSIIGNYAFDYCAGISGELVFGNRVEIIGQGAFSHWGDGERTLTFGESLKTIGNGAFQQSNFNGSLVIPDSVTEIGNEAFFQNKGFTGTLSLGKSVEIIGSEAFYGCAFTGELILPVSLQTIGESAFSNCEGFTGVLKIPTSVTSMGKGMFYLCRGFTELIFLNMPTEIPDRAFGLCSGLTGVLELPESLEYIGDSAFGGCDFTGVLNLPVKVKSVGSSAFSENGNITDLVLGEELETVGGFAFNFNGYQILKTVTCKAVNPPVCDNSTVFNSIDYKSVPLNVPTESIESYKEAIAWKEFSDIKGIGETEPSVSLDYSELNMNVGDSSIIVATIENGHFGEDYYTAIRWLSDDTGVATVDEVSINGNEFTGEIVAVSPGTAVIQATIVRKYDYELNNLNQESFALIEPYEVVSATCIVTVSEVQPDVIELNVTDLTLKAGDSTQLTATVYPENTSNKTIQWSSSDENVATVDNTGVVYGVSQGYATITATCQEVYAECQIEVYESYYDYIELNISEMTLEVGESQRLEAYVHTDRPDDLPIEWTAWNDYVAMVDENGLVTAYNPGETMVYARFAEAVDSCLVKVVERPLIEPPVLERPMAPTQMLRKGNGTTRTFVVLMPLPNSSLEELGYSYVYGYTDPNGLDVEIAHINLRYCRTSPEIYDNPANDFWVYALSTQTGDAPSFRVHLDGRVDEDFEGIGPSRSGIEGIYVDANDWVSMNGTGFSVEFQASQPAKLSVSTLDGKLILSKVYEAGEVVSEHLDKAILQSGIYIVSLTSGSRSFHKKLLIE